VRPHESGRPPAALPAAAGFRFALVVSRFNETITRALAAGARSALLAAGAAARDVEELHVPGAFELPQAARCIAETGRFDAILCLGCVIRGETPHFEYISAAVAQGIMDAAADTHLPIAFGVLTTDTVAQAEARAGEGPDNKGAEAARAAVEMAALFRRLGRPPARAGAGSRFGAAGGGDE
jgi:6,7-dimethyl-8-ribityllumazine synthase